MVAAEASATQEEAVETVVSASIATASRGPIHTEINKDAYHTWARRQAEEEAIRMADMTPAKRQEYEQSKQELAECMKFKRCSWM